MAKKIMMQIEKMLLKLFAERAIIINKIVVIGSYSKSLNKLGSDIDIIVISSNFRNRDIFERVEATSGIHRELVRKLNKPIDIMYYSDVEWERGRSLIINEAKQSGEIIYG